MRFSKVALSGILPERTQRPGRLEKTMSRYPGVIKLPDGRFRIRIKARNPKTGRVKELKRVIAVKTVADAVKERSELREQYEAIKAPVRRLRMKEYAESWLASKGGTLKLSTLDRYATAIDIHVLPSIGDMYVDAVEYVDIVSMRDNLAERLAPSTVNSVLRVVRTMFRDAVVELDLPRDPTARVKAQLEMRTDKDPNCLTGEQMARLLVAIQETYPQHYPVFRTLAETGMRIGEATSLRWEDIVPELGLIKVRRSHWRGYVGTTKTNCTRTVPLTPGLAKIFVEHRKQLLAEQAPGLANGWVFSSKDGKPKSYTSLQKPLTAALAKAGISERFTFQGFRRTFNNLSRQITTGEVVRAMMGHMTARMTEHYSHVEIEEKRSVVDQVVQLISPTKVESGT